MVDINNARTQVSSEIHEHPNNNSIHTVKEFIGLRGKVVIAMDLTNLDNPLEISVQEKIDGTNYRIKSFRVYPGDFLNSTQDGVVATLIGSGNDIKLSFRSQTEEGSVKNVELTLRETDSR